MALSSTPSSRTTCSSLAARLNDEAASYFERGDENSAFAAFKDALESLTTVSETNNSSTTEAGSSSASSEELLIPSPLPLNRIGIVPSPLATPVPTSSMARSPPPATASTPAPVPTTSSGDIATASFPRRRRFPEALTAMAHRTDEPISNDDEDPYFYDRFLFFDADRAKDPQAARYCSAVIIFNMALVFQKRGKDNPKTLYKALFLYVVSLKHMHHCPKHKNSNVVMAALNNQAIVYYHLREFGKARVVLGELWCLMRELRARPQPFLKSDVDGIVRNILLLLHSPSLAAAA